MTEIFQTLIQFLVFSLLFSFPITPQINNIYLKNYHFKFYDLICINIVINLNLYLLLSAFKFDLNILFMINILLAVSFFIFHFKKNLYFIIKSNTQLLILFFLINICFYFIVTNELKINWDGLVQWLPKAKQYHQGLGSINAGHFSYPHLGGFLWGYFWTNSFIEKEYIGRLIFIFIFVSSIFSLSSLLEKNINNIFKILFLTTIISLTYDKFLFGGYQDPLLFALLLISSKFLYLKTKNEKKLFPIIIFFLCAFICPWIKQEGFIYFVIMSFIVILFEKQKKKKIYFMITFFALTIIYFFLKNYFNGVSGFNQSINLNSLSTENFYLMFKIFKDITFNVFVAIYKYPIWIVIFIIILLSILNKKNISEFKYFYLFLILNILFVYSVVFYSCFNIGLSECRLIMRVSMDRIIYQISGFCLVWAIIMAKKAKLINNF